MTSNDSVLISARGDVDLTWYLKKKNKSIIYHFAEQTMTFTCSFAKGKPPNCKHICQRHISLPCLTLCLEGGPVCFHICQIFQHKGRRLLLSPAPSNRPASCLWMSLKQPLVIYVDLWALLPHRLKRFIDPRCQQQRVNCMWFASDTVIVSRWGRGCFPVHVLIPLPR